MRPFRATTTVTAMTTMLLLAGAGLAAAETPSNDTYDGRKAFGSVPFAATVDTTTATTDGDDAELNETCGAPATDASVWYEYTAPADGAIMIDVSASDYPAGVLVGTGGPGGWTIETCGPEAVLLPTTAGRTYAVLLIDDQSDGAGNGGTLRLSVTEAPPPPIVDVTVDPHGTFDPRTGGATVSGTVTCTGGPSEFSAVRTELQQRRGPFTLFAVGEVEVSCDATARPWTVELVSPNGPFGRGDAASLTLAYACGEAFCSSDYEEREIVLRRR